ncbi:chemotaxis protein [Ensifer adhaerens]|uniref:Chemotaxis protein n=1 Tax=Ensifer adhaerens TaxID=106592 RepID=A0A0L8BRB6_ENSAD|nr:chemotaxis protein MotC [Ensifer adhaerens]KOF17074.1 chemotaxis protein [Ensifer adhaerens]
MLRRLRSTLMMSALAIPLSAGMVHANDLGELAPFKMIRSLQYVQDSVVLGDHSAIEMQRFMLGAIDKRLRAADASVFGDPRNVDAALVYAMSGGNPETLNYLADHDVAGNFDSRVTDALSQYLGGKGGLIVESLSKAAPEYRNSRIGPYLFLILGNATSQQDPVEAMKFYDWARLTAPGTIIEEAALRRSVFLAVQANLPDKGFRYALNYARRYLTSPYASQFADVFVELAVGHFDEAAHERISEILTFMDAPRQREVYLRVARRAAISGKQTLAKLASERAEQLAADGASEPHVLANFYAGLASVPSSDVFAATQSIAAIPDAELSPRDRALRDAAKAVADAVVRPPDDESLTQAFSARPVRPATPEEQIDGAETGSGMSPFGEPAAQAGAPTAGETTQASAETAATSDPSHDGFVAKGRSKVEEIDALLRGEGK